MTGRTCFIGLAIAALVATRPGVPAVAGEAAKAAANLNYTLTVPGRISIVIYDAKGKLVRELLHADTRTAGAHDEPWDGRDTQGKPLPAGAYTWKLLETQGLKAEYLLTIGSNYPHGGSQFWQSDAPGNHMGPTAITVANGSVYVFAGMAEWVASGLKMDLAGPTTAWYEWQPRVMEGGNSAAVMNNTVYLLSNCANIFHFPDGQPNVNYNDAPLWNAVWPGDPQGGHQKQGRMDFYQFMDLTASDAGGTPQLVVSYNQHNAVRWFDSKSGAVLDTATVTAPTGVAIDKAGNVLAISGSTVVRFSRANKTPVTVITGLTSPWRLNVDRSSNEILVLERGKGQQVKRFSPDGTLIKAYGTPGGRPRNGLYNAEAGFINGNDIVSDGAGGFLVAEADDTPLRRVAHFRNDGTLVREWYGGERWCPNVAVEPGNPSVAWLESVGGCLTRVTIDYAKRTWRVHSTYDLKPLHPWISMSNNIEESGTGNGMWSPRRINGTLYLAINKHMLVLRVDETNWKLVPCVINSTGKMTPPNQLWTDNNGDGVIQDGETRPFIDWWASLRAPAPGLDYFHFGGNDDKVYRVRVTGYNTCHAPVYGEHDIYCTLPQDCLKPNGSADWHVQQHHFALGDDGALFCAFNVCQLDWGKVKDSRMIKWNPDGSLAWEVGSNSGKGYTSHKCPPWQVWSAFKNCIGTAYGCVIASDFLGGGQDQDWTAITYVWDQDGNWVGGMMERENCDVSHNPLIRYRLAGENGSGDLTTDPKTGDVYYFGSMENDSRVYRITGWDKFQRQHGTVSLK